MTDEQVYCDDARADNGSRQCAAGPAKNGPVTAPPPAAAPYSMPSFFRREPGVMAPSLPTCVLDPGAPLMWA